MLVRSGTGVWSGVGTGTDVWSGVGTKAGTGVWSGVGTLTWVVAVGIICWVWAEIGV